MQNPFLACGLYESRQWAMSHRSPFWVKSSIKPDELSCPFWVMPSAYLEEMSILDYTEYLLGLSAYLQGMPIPNRTYNLPLKRSPFCIEASRCFNRCPFGIITSIELDGVPILDQTQYFTWKGYLVWIVPCTLEEVPILDHTQYLTWKGTLTILHSVPWVSQTSGQKRQDTYTLSRVFTLRGHFCLCHWGKVHGSIY